MIRDIERYAACGARSFGGRRHASSADWFSSMTNEGRALA
jgi:hypothetical protein